MAHLLTHLTHGIPTRRPFHPAKTASAGTAIEEPEDSEAVRRGHIPQSEGRDGGVIGLDLVRIS